MTMALAVAMVACQAATPVEKTPVTLGGTALPDMSFPDFDADTAAAKTVTITGSHFKGTKLAYTATSSNKSVADATASGSTVTVTPKGAGSATVTVIAAATADDEQGTASLSFTVTVTAPVETMPEPPPDNNAPRLKAGKTLPHHTDLLYGGSEEIDLSEYFTDDEGDEISYNAVPNDEGVVTTSVSGSMLTITVVNHGDTTIIVTATDSYNQSRKEAFDVTVINQAPMIVADEPTRFGPYMPGDAQKITVSEYFTDVEGDSLEYTAAPSGETDAMFVTVTGPGADSIITITAKAVGEAMITITATDGTSVTSHTLTVTVSAVPNQAPEVVGDGIPDQSLEMDFADKMKTLDNLSMYFRDPDAGPNPTLAYEVSVPGMGMYANATVDGETLTITAVAAGTEMITVTASDGRHQASDTFNVTVTNPPVPTRTSERLGVQTLSSDGGPMTITGIEDYFNRATGFKVWSDNTNKVEVSKGEEAWSLTLTPVAAGEANVVVTPTNSGGDGATLTFRVEVTGPAAVVAPTNPTPIPPQKVVLGTPKTIDISMYFEGATNYSASGVTATVEAAVTADGMLTLTPVAHGTAEVRVTAINGAGAVSDDFDVTVQAKPMLKMEFMALKVTMVSDDGDAADDDFDATEITAIEDATERYMLKNYFTDPDGDVDDLMFSTATSDNMIVAVYPTPTPTTAPTGLDDTNKHLANPTAAQLKKLTAEGPDVMIRGRQAGTARITITATDANMLMEQRTFLVTVVGTSNTAPIVVDAGTTAFPGTDTDGNEYRAFATLADAGRFKSTATGSKTLTIDLGELFVDPDVEDPLPQGQRHRNDSWSFEADSDNKDVATVMLRLTNNRDEPDEHEVVITPGDSGEAKIYFKVTDSYGKSAGGLDDDGEPVANAFFTVKVNHKPVAMGGQATDVLTLAKVDTYLKLNVGDTSDNLPNVVLVNDPTNDVTAGNVVEGYFSDADEDYTDTDTDDEDTLSCRFTMRGANIFGMTTGTPAARVVPNWVAAATRQVINLSTLTIADVVGSRTTYLDVWCSDGFEDSPPATLTLTVASDRSIR